MRPPPSHDHAKTRPAVDDVPCYTPTRSTHGTVKIVATFCQPERWRRPLGAPSVCKTKKPLVARSSDELWFAKCIAQQLAFVSAQGGEPLAVERLPPSFETATTSSANRVAKTRGR